MKKRIICFALAACFALFAFAGCNSNSKPKDANISQADFFKLAIEQRFDYVPLFDEGSTPTNSSEYLMYAFILDKDNLKAQSEDFVKMPQSYVEEVASAHFKVDSLTHRPLLHTWDYNKDAGEYTATGWSYNSEPAYKLISCTTEERDGKTVYKAVAAPIGIEEFYVNLSLNSTEDLEYDAQSQGMRDFLALINDSGIYKEGMTYYDAFIALFDAGKGDSLPLTERTDTFTYYMEGDNAVFLAHEVAFSSPKTEGGVPVDDASDGAETQE